MKKSFKINTSRLLCAAIIFLQLLWMQTKVFWPDMKRSSMLYQLLFYMKYFGAALLLIYTSTVINKISGDRRRRQKQYIKILLPVLLLILAVEMIALVQSPVVSAYGLSYWTRCIAYILDKVCMLIEVSCIYLLCGKDSIKCVKSALVFDGILLAVIAVLRVGAAAAFVGLANIFEFSEGRFSILEVHELTYCIGLVLIFYLFFDKQKSIRKTALIILLVFLFVVGQKRIGNIGIIISGLFALIVHKRGLSKKTLIVTGCVGVGISLIYVALMYSGQALELMSEQDINVMGRDTVYTYFTRRTEFAVDYLGWGFSGVSKVIEDMSFSEVGTMMNVRGLHNDVLKIYIEAGFWGSVGWLMFNLVYVPVSVFAKFHRRTATLYMALVLFAFVTYLTDNTENYSVFQIVLLLIPLAAEEMGDHHPVTCDQRIQI